MLSVVNRRNVNTRTARRISRAGFTLFEAVVALLLIGIVAVSTLSTVAAQLRGEARARRTAEVESLAQDRMVALQLLDANGLQSLPDSVAGGRFPLPFQQYSWQAISRPVMGEDYLNDVSVRISWEGGAYTINSRIYRAPEVVTLTGGGQ